LINGKSLKGSEKIVKEVQNLEAKHLISFKDVIRRGRFETEIVPACFIETVNENLISKRKYTKHKVRRGLIR